MSSTIKAFLVSEPSGRPAAVVLFSGALIFLGMYVYFGILGDSPTIFELFLAGAFALSGTAESLPKQNRRVAGALRFTAIVIPLIMILILAIAPEIINPR
jgi:hypothetical protein